jgi:hypothetical protein
MRWVARQPRQEQDRRGGSLLWPSRLAAMLAAAREGRGPAAVTAGGRARHATLLYAGARGQTSGVCVCVRFLPYCTLGFHTDTTW